MLNLQGIIGRIVTWRAPNDIRPTEGRVVGGYLAPRDCIDGREVNEPVAILLCLCHDGQIVPRRAIDVTLVSAARPDAPGPLPRCVCGAVAWQWQTRRNPPNLINIDPTTRTILCVQCGRGMDPEDAKTFPPEAP